MSNHRKLSCRTASLTLRAIGLCTLLGIATIGAGACDSLNPSLLSLIDPGGAGGFTSLPNAPGHVVITFVNNAEVDERLLAFLESTEGGNLGLTDVEKRSLRPRLRLRVRVTYSDGTDRTIEFINGSRNLVDQSFSAQVSPDLNKNDLGNAVVLCDVASVELEPGSDIDVFVPVELTAFELIETTNQGGTVIANTFEARERTPPRFQPLQVDQVDSDGNVVLQQNIGVQDVPSPATNIRCGSVIAISVNGVLTVPFLDGISDRPSYDREDNTTVAGIGGRYEFRVSVQ